MQNMHNYIYTIQTFGSKQKLELNSNLNYILFYQLIIMFYK